MSDQQNPPKLQTTFPEVDFISPDRKAEKRLKDMLGISKTNRYDDLPSYLESARS